MQDASRREWMLGVGATPVALAASTGGASASAPNPDLSGVSILITGCSSGFGRLGAEHYARCGAKVFATMRKLPRPEAEELSALAAREGLDISVLEIDVTSDAQVEAGVAAALQANGGKLDVLVNNAGIACSGPVEVQDLAMTQLMFETNVFGPQRMIRAALPAMREAKRGLIFNVSSQLGRLVIPSLGQYSATKFALEALSEQLAYETYAHGVEVVVIQPGGFPTKISEKGAALAAELKARTPDPLLAAYGPLTARMGAAAGGGGRTDPMDVPRAIAEIIAMPAGTRPLRRPVHPISRPQEPINEVSAKQQMAMLGQTPFRPAAAAVLD